MSVRAVDLIDAVFGGIAVLRWVPTNDQKADVLTKPLQKIKHSEARRMLKLFMTEVTSSAVKVKKESQKAIFKCQECHLIYRQSEKHHICTGPVVEAHMMEVFQTAAAKALTSVAAAAIESALTQSPIVVDCLPPPPPCPSSNFWWGAAAGASALATIQVGVNRIKKKCCKRRIRDVGSQSQCSYDRRSDELGRCQGKFRFLGSIGVDSFQEIGAPRDA